MDREGGFIVVWRRLQSSALYQALTDRERAVFFTILLLANWKDERRLLIGRWVTIERGELCQTLETIAKEARSSVKVARTTVGKLMLDDRAAGGNGPFLSERWTGTEEGRGIRILKVEKYDDYQRIAAEEGTEHGAARGEGRAQVGHESGTGRALLEPVEPVEPREPSLFGAADATPRAGGAKRTRKPKEEAPSDPRHHPLQQMLERVFGEVRGGGYGFQKRDAAAIAEILRLSHGDATEVERRWRAGLGEVGFRRSDTIHDLAQKWNAYTGRGREPSRRNGGALDVGRPEEFSGGYEPIPDPTRSEVS